MGLYVLLPLIAGYFTRRILVAKGGAAAVDAFKFRVQPFSIFGLLVTVFVKQFVRRFHAASLISGALISVSGLSQTGLAVWQLRVLPDQRSRFCARAFAWRLARFASVARSAPAWHVFGVTKRVARCWCAPIYPPVSA